jgi:hypothetical protein
LKSKGENKKQVYPSRYKKGTELLNFGAWVRTGVLTILWPFFSSVATKKNQMAGDLNGRTTVQR